MQPGQKPSLHWLRNTSMVLSLGTNVDNVLLLWLGEFEQGPLKHCVVSQEAVVLCRWLRTICLQQAALFPNNAHAALLISTLALHCVLIRLVSCSHLQR